MPQEESQAIIRFVDGYAEEGLGANGLPNYRPTIRIIKSVPPYTEVNYEATERDFSDFPGPYQIYLKEQAALRQVPQADGFPLALWPVINHAQLRMLAARDITTVEQLAKLDDRDPAIPGDLKEVAERARQMLLLSSKLGKFEAMIRDRDGQIEALAEQVRELRATVSARDAMINSMRMLAPGPGDSPHA